MKIKFVGLKDLKEDEKGLFETLCIEHCEKFEKHWNRFIKPENEMNLGVKKYNRDGQRVKFSVHVHAVLPKFNLSASADDWDINSVLNGLFDKINNEAKKHYKA